MHNVCSFFLSLHRAKCVLEILASHGAAVAIIDIKGEAANLAAEELRKAHGTGYIGLGCDVAKYHQVEAAVKGTVESLGGLHCALNAPGLPGWLGNARPRLAENSLE